MSSLHCVAIAELCVEGRALDKLHASTAYFQCRDRFIEAVSARTHGGDDAGLAIATERVLEQEGQLRVSISNVRGLLVGDGLERAHHGTERGQRLVDHVGLLQRGSCSLGALCHSMHGSRVSVRSLTLSTSAIHSH